MATKSLTNEISVQGTAVRFHSDGIIEYDYAAVDVDEAHARAVIAATTAAMSPIRQAPTLVQLGRVKSVSRGARTFFSSSKENLAIASRVAMVGVNPVARVIGNFFLGLNRPPIPVRLFAGEEEAISWLQSGLP